MQWNFKAVVAYLFQNKVMFLLKIMPLTYDERLIMSGLPALCGHLPIHPEGGGVLMRGVQRRGGHRGIKFFSNGT